ncbi:MAG: ABC transporter permease [Lachnospiraceae bacterium]|nr:ABC transporter permease [Lachnospiraceae bacterium]
MAEKTTVKKGNPFSTFFKNNGAILIGYAILVLALCIITGDTFMTTSNILNVLRQAVQNSLMAFGITFILINGCVDLSVGANCATTGVIMVLFLNMGVPFVLCVLITLACGALMGLFNGYFVTEWNLIPYVVTLASQNIYRGLGYVISGGLPVRNTDPNFTYIGNGYVGPIPFPIILMLFCWIICSIFMSRTVTGRHMYAVGGNQEAAQYSGINPKRIKRIAYTFSGVLSAIAGIVLAAKLFSGQPSSGVGYEGDAIASNVLGGVSMKGGTGTHTGALIGALVLATLTNGFNLLQVDFYYQMIVKGFVIILAVEIDVLKKAAEEANISLKELLFPKKK